MRVPVFNLFTRIETPERAVEDAPLSVTEASDLARHLAAERKPDRDTAGRQLSSSGRCPNCKRKTEPSSQMCWCGYRLQVS